MDPEDQKRRSRGISRDMSPGSISRRLEVMGQLHEVWQLLRRARRIGPVEVPGTVREPSPPRCRGLG